MTNTVKNVVIFIFVIVVSVCIAGYLFISNLPDLCSNEIVSETVSPDGSKKAVIFSRDCGATADFSTHLAVVKRDESIESTSSMFAANTNRGMAKAGPGGGPEVIATWLSEDSLLVVYSRKAGVVKQEAEFSGINIKYEMRE